MYHLTKIKIDGFWDSYTIQADFNPDVNIFIGKNGTGKTTMINILQSILTVDIALIQASNFSNVHLELMRGQKKRTINVSRIDDKNSPFEILKYKISRMNFEVPLLPSEYGYNRRIHPKYTEDLHRLKSMLSELVDVSWLSVHRDVFEHSERDDVRKRLPIGESPVDRRLADLMKQFTSYQLKLEGNASRRSTQFQNDVLKSTLYSKSLDSYDPSQEPQLIHEKEELIHAFEELGVPIDEKRIETHIKALAKSISTVRKEKELTIQDVLPLSLLQRTKHIIELSRDAEKDKRRIFEHRSNFIRLLHEFVEDKQFDLSSDGKLLVKMRDSGRDLEIRQLSSGEKQLLILLTEALLQEHKPFIFIADEPELSLHIEWQEKLLGAIRSLNDKAQLIIATHSPEIVSEFTNSTFDMEELST